ncbi:MAG: hypothetical protein JEY79_01860 [Pseudodesulfovibrio sp.]|nr:hypothetical protein [Pseudodesulfovibrio sp.]
MKIVQYCQHVLGVGHIHRSLEIAKALAPHEVTLVTGGAEADLELPDNVCRIQLPGLMMDADFSRFIPVEDGTDVDEVLIRRLTRFKELMAEIQPDIFLVELFPFGRKKFGFELLPILENVKAGTYGSCKSVCSLRDILVEKKDQASYEKRVLSQLNSLFDALLVHADPELVRLDETFTAAKDITIPIHYTGYVTPKPTRNAGAILAKELKLSGMPLIVASAGGGNIGQEMLEATIRASVILAETTPHRLTVFTGPYASDHEFIRLAELAVNHPGISVQRFTSQFPAYLDAASLSVSMAGYNTTMNLLAAGTYGLALPFDQNREQRMRAERIETKGALKVLGENDLEPTIFARLMADTLTRHVEPHGIDLDGARKSAQILCELYNCQENQPQ